jgi:transcriptional regulator with XRE-family HTH domain
VPNNAIDDEDWARYAREFGQKLQRLRTERRLTQEHVAYTAGVTRTTYQRLEKNENRPGAPANPSLSNIVAIAAALGVDVAELLPKWKPDVNP